MKKSPSKQRKEIPEQSLLRTHSISQILQMHRDGQLPQFGAGDEDRGAGLTCEAVGELLGVSKMRAYQIECDAMLKVIRALKQHPIFANKPTLDIWEHHLQRLQNEREAHDIWLAERKQILLAKNAVLRSAGLLKRKVDKTHNAQ